MADTHDSDMQAPPNGTDRKRLGVLTLAALGVVYGDIGTSPLYAVRECFHGEFGIAASPANVLGVLSLMFWALLVIVSTKYLGFILRADNNGEGGVIALTALIARKSRRTAVGRWALLGMGLFAASLLYGDGMITPAISVLSAVEGLQLIAPSLGSYVIPVTVAILAGLFLIQRKGTGTVGFLFGPVTLIWFVVIGALGLHGIIGHPGILAAVNPWYGAQFLLHNGTHGFLVLGAVFLVVTGAEALYADLGHFGIQPIRRAWYLAVLPALLCSYFGQGALLLVNPGESHHPFYALAPSWSLIPLVALATAATIIASQAVITGAFSLTRQAIQMGYLPRLRILHTSESEIGQVYVPRVNWWLMLATITLVLGFQSSSKLAAAYGVAVTTTMAIATILFFVVIRERWGWGLLRAGLLAGAFLVVDLCFFAANLGKITHGAWFPLVVGAVIYFFMTTWRKGRILLAQKLYANNPPLSEFLNDIKEHPPLRVPGAAVYLAGSLNATPPALLHNLKHNKVLHSKVGILSVRTAPVPTVERDEIVTVEELDTDFYLIVAQIGFQDEPNVPHILALAEEKGLGFNIEDTTFIIGRERLLPDRRPLMTPWRESIFAFVAHNTEGPTAYFSLPPDRVLEVGSQLRI